MDPASITPAPPSWMAGRASGVLAHLSSLPGVAGVGDLGPPTVHFLEFLVRAGQTWWQMLPVGPTGLGNSPYQSPSSFAGNPLFVTAEDGADPILEGERVDYPAARRRRERQLRRAYGRLRGDELERFEAFRAAPPAWLPDYALFAAIREARLEQPWWKWPAPIRDRDPEALADARRYGFAEEIRYQEYVQFLFDVEWDYLARGCRRRGVRLIGDLPIYVAHDSAEVWAHRELFDLLPDGTPRAVAGVPPDYFSKEGQLWGNPLYRWEEHARTGFEWWIDRLRVTLSRFDVVRLDHFIGFVNYWAVPRDAPTARAGHWEKGPGAAFFERVREALGGLPFLAEDLGEVTPPVSALRDSLALPGMRVLQFSFGRDQDAPEHYPENAAAYTGTHDNDTLLGWLRTPPEDGDPATLAAWRAERERALACVGGDGPDVHRRLTRWLFSSPSRLAVVPLQDVLGLGSEARMNRPGTTRGNWEWHCSRSDLENGDAADALREITQASSRALASGEAPR